MRNSARRLRAAAISADTLARRFELAQHYRFVSTLLAQHLLPPLLLPVPLLSAAARAASKHLD